MNSIIVFTLNGCGHCKNLKKRLNDIDVLFTEIEIGLNEHIWNQVVEQTGHNVLPTVFIKKENTDDGLVYIPGRDYQSEDEIVEIIKTFV